MDPKIIGAFGVLSMCCISSSIAASMMGGEEEKPDVPDTTGADTTGADASGADTSGADTSGADTSGADNLEAYNPIISLDGKFSLVSDREGGRVCQDGNEGVKCHKGLAVNEWERFKLVPL